MRFTNNTTSSLSSLPERIDHGNAAAADGIAVSANTTCIARNMPVDTVSANLAGSEHPQHVTYSHALQHGSSTRLPTMNRSSINPYLTSDILPNPNPKHLAPVLCKSGPQDYWVINLSCIRTQTRRRHWLQKFGWANQRLENRVAKSNLLV